MKPARRVRTWPLGGLAVSLALTALLGGGRGTSAAECVPAASPDPTALCRLHLAEAVARELSSDTAQLSVFLEQALRQCPADGELFHAYARVVWREGDLEAALRALTRACEFGADPREATLDLGRVHLERGAATEAVGVLTEAQALFPDDPEVAYLLGVALVRAGDPAGADGALAARGVRSDPVIGPRAAYYAGLSAYHGGDPGRAQTAFLAATQGPFAAEADRMLGVLRGLEAGPFASGYVTLGAGYDTNAVFDPVSPVGGAEEGRGSPRFTLDAGLVLRPIRAANHMLWGQLDVARVQFLGDPATQFSQTGLRGQVSYRHRFTGFGVAQVLQVGYEGGLEFLDGGALLVHDGFHADFEGHGVHVAWGLAPHADWNIEVGLRARYQAFSALVRDGFSEQVHVGVAWALWDGRVRLHLRPTVRLDQARGDEYEAWSAGVLAGVSAAFAGGWEVITFGRYAYDDFFRSAGWFAFGDDAAGAAAPRRTDHTVAGHAEVAYRWSFLRVALRYTAMFRPSSVRAFDFRRHVAGITVGGIF